MNEISQEDLEILRKAFLPLVRMKITWLLIPSEALAGYEPSQLAVIIDTLLDGLLPQIEVLATDPESTEKLKSIRLTKAPGEIGEREAYPDYIHESGKRVELKGLFIDNPNLKLKRPPTPREPSARLKENITIEKVDPKNDVLLVTAIQLREEKGDCYPFIIDIGVFPMVECIKARDKRLLDSGGRWVGNIPKVVSTKGQKKLKKGEELSEGDYEKDTNFGKLKRIPYPPLEKFLKKHGYG